MKKYSDNSNPVRRVLITGKNSYIGTSFEKWAKEHYADNFIIETLDMLDNSWKNSDFSVYDTVFHVAGIAHADISKVSYEKKSLYYRVNRDLAIQTAEKAKEDGVRQFVFMSSIIVYGKTRIITKDTLPSPSNCYGDSKWQADMEVRKLQSNDFNVAVIRPPMIYGKGCKGNYATLEKLAKKLPVFPYLKNERSMLDIDRFSDFLCKLILSGESGIFFPQNPDYACTSDIVEKIAADNNHKIFVSRIFNPIVWIASKIPGKIGNMTDKAFGNLKYEMSMSECSFDDFIEMTAKDCNKDGMLLIK